MQTSESRERWARGVLDSGWVSDGCCSACCGCWARQCCVAWWDFIAPPPYSTYLIPASWTGEKALKRLAACKSAPCQFTELSSCRGDGVRAEVPACVMKEAICFWSISNGFVQGQSISCSLLVALNFYPGMILLDTVECFLQVHGKERKPILLSANFLLDVVRSSCQRSSTVALHGSIHSLKYSSMKVMGASSCIWHLLRIRSRLCGANAFGQTWGNSANTRNRWNSTDHIHSHSAESAHFLCLVCLAASPDAHLFSGRIDESKNEAVWLLGCMWRSERKGAAGKYSRVQCVRTSFWYLS